MTGGIGFSRQGKQAFDDNHKLGKIRAKSSRPGIFLERNSGETASLSESIAHLQAIRGRRRKISFWISSVLALGMILLMVLLLFFN